MLSHHKNWRGVSLIELLIVLFIIGVLSSLGVPALMRSLETSRVKICDNNLHQISTALSNYTLGHKKVPDAPEIGKVGGWSFELLPYLDEQNIFQQLLRGAEISSVPEFARKRPRIMTCPFSPIDLSENPLMQANHYVYSKGGIYDSPLNTKQAWLNSYIIPFDKIKNSDGPHDGKYQFVNSGGGVQQYAKPD